MLVVNQTPCPLQDKIDAFISLLLLLQDLGIHPKVEDVLTAVKEAVAPQGVKEAATTSA